MADREARMRDLQNQLHQLDMEARGSALTPGEAEKNHDQRAALQAELRDLGEPGSDRPLDLTGGRDSAPPVPG